MGAPRSQKAEYRPIGFLLQDLGNRANDFSWVRFNIRPEDLTVTEPSRLTVQQTLGGAWADNFGEGIKNVNISGHTGWRARFDDEDGFTLFKRLNNTVFKQWHAKRKAAIEAGRDPDLIQLVLVDELDELIYVVCPMNFTLRRSKSRPLLMQYQISLIAIADTAEVDSTVLIPASIADGISLDPIAKGHEKVTPEKPPSKSVVDSLRDSVKKLKALAEGVDGFVDRTIGKPAKAFMDVTNSVLEVTTETVSGIQGSVDTATASLIGTAAALAQAGRNINHTLSAIENIEGPIKARFAEIAAAYRNAECVLKNAFDVENNYPDYSSLYGASSCSSTSGGAPLSEFRNENPLYRVNPVIPSSPVAVTPEAQAAVGGLANMDILQSSPNEDLAAKMAAAAGGVQVAA